MMPAKLYSVIFLYSVIIMTLIAANYLSKQSYRQIRDNKGNLIFPIIICLVFGWWLGHRPPTYEFADTGNYAHVYYLIQNGIGGTFEKSSEWVWNFIAFICAPIMDVSSYFTIIALAYFFCTLFACVILSKRNVTYLFLFCIGAYSFFSYATNGIRNGLACSILLLAISFFTSSRKNFFISITLSFVAFCIHRSTILPIASLFASIYVVKSFKWVYSFWVLSILISLIAGDLISSFFISLGFDDRITSYLSSTSNGIYTDKGFRWDFLIYSMMPIILGYYIVIKRGIQDRTYLILLNTYTLANAFWVMIIRANYSNRFAYLSWFMYPIILAYPLLKLNIWGKEQGKYTSRIMLAHVGFTWFMSLI